MLMRLYKCLDFLLNWCSNIYVHWSVSSILEQMTTFDFVFLWFDDFKSCYCSLRTNFTDIFSCIFRFHIVENKWSLFLFACRLKFDIIRSKFDIILVPSCRSGLIRCLTDNFNCTRWFNLNWFDLLWNFKDNFWRCTKSNLGLSYSKGKIIHIPADDYVQLNPLKSNAYFL